MHALVLIAAVCVSQEREALGPIDVRSTIHVGGVAVDEKGQPVEGVDVRWLWVATGQKGADPEAARTDGQGRFSLDAKVVNRPRLLWMLRGDSLEATFCLIRPGFAFTKVSVQPEWLSGEEARVVLPTAEELAVRVLDPAGAPVSGATVSVDGYPRRNLEKEQIIAEFPSPSKTDDQGRTLIDGVNRSRVRSLTVETREFGRQDYVVSDGMVLPEEVVLPLRPVGRLVGRVRADDPAAARKVLVDLIDYTSLRSEHTLKSGLKPTSGGLLLRTDDEGKFEVPALPNGEWGAVIFSDNDLGYVIREEIVKVETGKTAEVSLLRERGILVHGQVRDRDSGRPLAHAKIRLRTTPYVPGTTGRAETDGSGRYQLVLGPGRVSVSLEQAGEFCLPANRPVDFAEIRAGVQEFELPPIEAERGRRLTGLVLDEDGEPSGPGRVKAVWVKYPGTPEAAVGQVDEYVDEKGRFVLHAMPRDVPLEVFALTEEAASKSVSEVLAYNPSKSRYLFFDVDSPMFLYRGPVVRDRPIPRILRFNMPKLELPQDRAVVLEMPVAVKTGLDVEQPIRAIGRAREFVPPPLPSDFDPSGEPRPEFVIKVGKPIGVPGHLPWAVEEMPDITLSVSKDQLRSLEGRVIDTIGEPVKDARVWVMVEGTLPGRLTWKDYLYDDGAWEVHTDALGRFETPRRVPAFLKCSAQVRREGRGPATSSATFAPTTPSFFDIEIPRDPPADEKVVWERVQAGLNAYNNAAFDEARGRYAEALEEAERLERKAPLLRAYLLQQQAHACRMLEKYDDAKALYRLALDLRREALGEDDPLAVGLLNDLAYSDKMAGHYVEMAKELHEVLRWSKGRRANPLFARCSLILGDMCSWELKNYRNSENFLNYSYHAYEEIYGPDAWQLIDVLNCQALNQERAGAPDQAEPLARRAVEIADRYQYGRSPSSQLYMASLLEAHARVLKALGRGEEAKKAGTRAKGLRELRKPGAVQ